MNFDFKVIAKGFPSICLVAGVALVVGYYFDLLGFGAVLLGVFLILVGIGLYVFRFLQRGR